MNKEKLYQTNIYKLLECLEHKINWEEAFYENTFCGAPNSYGAGHHAGVVNTLNNLFCAVKDLQQKTFNGKEFTKDEIENLLNEKP